MWDLQNSLRNAELKFVLNRCGTHAHGRGPPASDGVASRLDASVYRCGPSAQVATCCRLAGGCFGCFNVSKEQVLTTRDGSPWWRVGVRPRKGSRIMFSHPKGPTMQPCAPKEQGSLFDMGCTKAEELSCSAWRWQLLAR
eukprot:1140881-Pelagomonas_calceolata.AAC.2